ncbi:MAG: autotransporter-associated beta strand repeat-containing protein [Verrucomicrobiota bacterium]
MINTHLVVVLKTFLHPLRRTLVGGAGLAGIRSVGRAAKLAVLAAATGLVFGLFNHAGAANYTFNGLGADGNFTTTANWVAPAPANNNGNDFTYAVASGGQTNLTNNFGGNLYSQTFAAGCVPLTISETLQELQGGNPYFVQNLSANLQTLTGTLSVFAGSSSFNSSNGPLSLGALTIRNDLVNPVNIILDGPFNGTVNGSITKGSGNGSLIKKGTGTWELKGVLPTLGTTNINFINAGTLILSGANTTANTNRIVGGTLVLNNTNALQSGILDMNSTDAGLLQFGSTINAATLGALQGTRNIVLTNNSGSAVALSIGNNNGSTSYGGVLSGTGSGLTKVGTGTLTLSTPVTLTGPVRISGGALAFPALNTIQTVSGVTVTGGELQPNAASGTYASNSITITGAGVGGSSQGALDFHQGGNSSCVWPGGVTLNGGASIGSFGVTMQTKLANPIIGTGPLTISCQGGSAAAHWAEFTLGAASTYSGGTTFHENGGLLWFTVTNGVANALPPTTTLTLWSGGTVCYYDLNGFNQTLGGLSSTLTGVGSAHLINSSATAVTLTISNASSSTYAGTLGAPGANNLNLVKDGFGTETLSGTTNSYTGTTTISNGMLQATSLGAGDVTVMSGAGLGAGPSNSVATLALAGNLTLNSSVLNYDITNNTGNADLITVAGNLTPNGVTAINLSTLTPIPDGDYTLLQVAGSLNGTAANFSVANALGQTYSIFYATSPNRVMLHVVTTVVLAKTWVGDGSANQWNINSGLDWVDTTGGSTLYVYHDNDQVTINDLATNLTVNLTVPVSPATVTVFNTNKNFLIQGAGKISGTTGLSKQGAATLILANSTANDYAGTTTLSGGTLQIGNGTAAGSLGSGNVSVTAAGTTLAFNRSDSITVNNPIANAGANPSLAINSGGVTLGGSADNVGAAAAVTNATLILAKTSTASVHAIGSGLTIKTGGLTQLGGSGGDQIYNNATVTLSGGTYDMAGQSETVGTFIGYGVITNSGAAATNTAGGGVNGNAAGALFASGGVLSLQSGTVTVGGAWNQQFGVAGGATFNQVGGTLNSGSYFAIGNSSGTGTANMTISGGTFNSTSELLCGFSAPGNLTVSGTASLNLNFLSWGDPTNRNVNMALNGGTILLNRFNNRGTSPGVVSFNGSLLQANSTQAAFMNAATNLTANISTGGALFDSQSFSITLNAPLLHDPALGATLDGGVKKVAGTGALILTGTNTYTGPTIVSNGILNTTTASLGGGSYAVSDNATLGVSIANPGQSLTVSSLTLGSAAGPSTNNFTLGSVAPTAAVVTNSGALTLNGPVTVNVSGTNLNPGTIVLIAYGSGGAGTFVAGTLPVQPGYTFSLVNNTSAKQLQLVVTTTIPPLRWAVGDGTWDTATQNWMLLFGGTPAFYAENDPVTFDDTNSGGSTINVTLDVDHTPGNVTVNNFAKTYVFGGAAIAGAAGLTKTGTNTLTLTVANSYTGGTAIKGGTLILNSSTGPALSSATAVNTNGTLQLSSGGDQIAAGVTVTMAGGMFDMAGQTESFTALNGYGTVADGVGGGALTATAACTVSGGTMALQSGGFTFNNTVGSPALTINSGATFSQSGGTINCPSYVYGNGQITISGGTFGCGLELMPGFSSAAALTVSGTGKVDTYVLRVGSGGNSTINLLSGGTLLTDQVYPDGAGTSLFYFNGGTLGISTRNPNRIPANWFQSVTHAYVSTNGAIIDTSNNGGHVYTITAALQSDPALGSTFDGGLTKLGAGTLTLSNANTYTGPTYINAGTLSLGNNGSIANSSLISINNGATFDVSGLSLPPTLAISQTLSNNAASTGTLKGSLNTGSGTVSLSFAAGTPALYVASGTLTLSSLTTLVVDNTGGQLTDGIYPIITNAATATIAGSLPASVAVTDGGAAGTPSLQINSFGLCLVVGTLAPTINPEPVSLTRYVGGTAVFSAGVVASPVAQLQWEFNGVPINGATNASLVLTNLQLAQAGTYVLTATNSAGGAISDGTAILAVLPANTPQYVATVLSDSPIGYWRFNDGESTMALDSVGVNNVYDPLAAALQTGPRPAPFPGFESTNTAPFLDGSSQGYASTVSLFNNRTNYTIMGWFNLDPAQYPVSADPFSHPQARTSLFGQAQMVELGFYGPVTGTNLYFFSHGISGTIFVTNSFAPGQWEYVAVVADATHNTTTVYLNGQVVGTATAGTAFANTNLFSIGKNVTYPTSSESGFDTAFFPGSIDEVAVFDHPLSAAAVQAIYNVGAGIVSAVAPTNVVAKIVNLNGVNSVVITGSGGAGSYTVLTSTNLTAPLANWTTSATGQAFGTGGAVNYTNAVSPGMPRLFYRIRVP